MPDGDRCTVCGEQIQLMVRRGTDLCSENCEKSLKTPISKENP